MELTTDDPCAGLDAPDGRSFRPDRRGVLTLPEELAGYGRQAARVTPLFHERRPRWAGFDAAALREQYAAWERAGAQANALRLVPELSPASAAPLRPERNDAVWSNSYEGTGRAGDQMNPIGLSAEPDGQA